MAINKKVKQKPTASAMFIFACLLVTTIHFMTMRTRDFHPLDWDQFKLSLSCCEEGYCLQMPPVLLVPWMYELPSFRFS
jgi:hypothetical protein